MLKTPGPTLMRRGLAITIVSALAASAAMAAVPPRGKVIAVDKRTGRAAWEAALWSRPDAAVPPLVTPELLYVLEEGRLLRALDAATGKVRWKARVATRIPLTLAGERLIVVTGNKARAYNRWTGKQLWECNLQLFPEWKLDEHSIPVVAPGRLLLPAGNTVIAVDPATGQPAWAYTVTAAKLPLQPVVLDGLVYLQSEQGTDRTEVILSLMDGLPNTGEYLLPADIARAIERQRKKELKKAPVVARPAAAGKQTPFVAVKTKLAAGGKALAAAGAKSWSYKAPAGWKIDRVAGESAGHLYAILGAGAPGRQPASR